jgi:hypothetical protein
MGRIFFMIVLLAVGFVGFGTGSGLLRKEPSLHRTSMKVTLSSARAREFKSFAVVLYAQNDSAWCERALRSIFEQDYDYARLIVIDDASRDGTMEKIKQFILANGQEHRTVLIQNETPLGWSASLFRAAEQCLPREIVFPLKASNWMSQPGILSMVNRAFQSPDVWALRGQALSYPSYETENEGPLCFYSGLLKAVPAHSRLTFQATLLDLAGPRGCQIEERLCFFNETLPNLSVDPASLQPIVRCEPLAEFP